MSTNTSPIDSVVIDHNLMSGGGYTVYCGTDSGGVDHELTYTNNVISREFFPQRRLLGADDGMRQGRRLGRTTSWDGNYVPPAGPGGPPGGAAGGGARRRLRRRCDAEAALTYLLSNARARKLTRTRARARARAALHPPRQASCALACRRRSVHRRVHRDVEGPHRRAAVRRHGHRDAVAANTLALLAARQARPKLIKRTGRVRASSSRRGACTTRRRWPSRMRPVTVGCGHCGAPVTAAAA